MSDYAIICKYLRSEKVTERAKVKTKLLEFVNGDKVKTSMTGKQWLELLRCVLLWEMVEIETAFKKNRPQNIDNAILVKQVVKYGSKVCIATSSKICDIFEHVLRIMMDRELEIKYREHHLELLCDLLSTSQINHALSIKVYEDVFTFIRNVISAANITDRFFARLLRSFCRCIYLDISTDLIPRILNYLNDLLRDSVLDTLVLEKALLVVCDCYVQLLQHRGVNIIADAFKHSELLLSLCAEHLISITVHHRDPILFFLDAFISLCTPSDFLLVAPLCTLNPLSKVLFSLQAAIFDESYIKTLFTYVQVNKKQKDTFQNYLEDSKYYQSLIVSAKVLHQCTTMSMPNAGVRTLFDRIQNSSSIFLEYGLHLFYMLCEAYPSGEFLGTLNDNHSRCTELAAWLDLLLTKSSTSDIQAFSSLILCLKPALNLTISLSKNFTSHSVSQLRDVWVEIMSMILRNLHAKHNEKCYRNQSFDILAKLLKSQLVSQSTMSDHLPMLWKYMPEFADHRLLETPSTLRYFITLSFLSPVTQFVNIDSEYLVFLKNQEPQSPCFALSECLQTRVIMYFIFWLRHQFDCSAAMRSQLPVNIIDLSQYLFNSVVCSLLGEDESLKFELDRYVYSSEPTCLPNVKNSDTVVFTSSLTSKATESDAKTVLQWLYMLYNDLVHMLEKETISDDSEYASPALCISCVLMAGYSALCTVLRKYIASTSDADESESFWEMHRSSISHLNDLIVLVCKMLSLRCGLLQGPCVAQSIMCVICACLESSKVDSYPPELDIALKSLYFSVMMQSYAPQDRQQLSSRSPSVNSRHQRSHASFDDDFMEDASGSNIGCTMDIEIEEKSLRVLLTEKRIELLTRIVHAIVLVCPENDAVNFIIESTMRATVNGEEKPLLCPPDLLCRLGCVIASVTMCSAIKHIVTVHPWDAFMGAPGYALMLRLISALLSNGKGHHSPEYEIFANEINQLVFPTHHALLEYGEIYWKVRYEKLFCVAQLFELDQEMYKQQFGQVVVTGVHDVDIRVRVAASRIFSRAFLLRKSRLSHEAIYSSLVDSMDIAQLCHPQDFDDSYALNIMSFVHALSLCAMSSDVICLQAVKDILCITTGNQSLAGAVISIVDVARSALGIVAESYNYASEADMIADNAFYILKEWNNFSSCHQCNWEWREFPYVLIGYDHYAEFALQLGTAIVPVICEHRSASTRWKFFVSFSSDTKYGTHDEGVANCLVDYLSSAFAFHLNSIGADECILEFIMRVLDKSIIEAYVPNNFTAIIEQILLQAPYSASHNDDFENHIRRTLMAAATLVKPKSVDNIVCKCNLLQVLSTLRSKMLSCAIAPLVHQYITAFRVFASVTIPHLTVFAIEKYHCIVLEYVHVLQTSMKVFRSDVVLVMQTVVDVVGMICDTWHSAPAETYMHSVASELVSLITGLVICSTSESRHRVIRILEKEFGYTVAELSVKRVVLEQLLEKLLFQIPSDCLSIPVTESLAVLLPHAIRGYFPARDPHQQLADFVHYCSKFLAGDITSVLLLRFHIFALHDLVTSTENNFEHGELASLTMSLVALGKYFGTAHAVVQEEISLLLGSIGPLDIYQLPHTAMNSPAAVACCLDMTVSLAKIMKRVFGCMWNGDARVSIMARDSLRLLASQSEIKLSQITDFDESLKISLEFSPAISNRANTAAKDCWADTLWDSSGVSFECWICRVTCALMCEYCALMQNEKTEDALFMLTCFIKVCQADFGIAEMVFPLVVYGLSKAFDNQLQARLSSCILRFMLDSQCSIQASKLAIDTMIFLLRQNIQAFILQSSRPMKKRPIGAHGLRPKWVIPFTCRLDIDYEVAIGAAIRCGSVCSALLLMELKNEIARYEGNEILSSNDVSSLLLIYRELHDADAIYGISMTPNLEMQGAVFAHTGHWAEALATYESLARLESATSIVSPMSGIALSLQGLGAQYVLQHCHFDSDIDAIGESRWRNLSSQASLADISLRKWSVTGKTNSTDYYNRSIASSLRAVGCRDASSSSLDRITADGMFSDITSSAARQSGHRMVHIISKLQQLTEIQEILDLRNKQSVSSSLSQLMHLWERRLEHVAHNSTLSESILALRLSIMSQLHESLDVTEPLFCILHQMREASSTATVAHALSPLVYTLGSLLPLDAVNGISLVPLRWRLEECRFLWRKSQGDVALPSILRNVIEPLKSYTQKDSAEYKLLMSDALRLAGEWMSSRRSTSGGDIISEYLSPAVELATTISQAISAHSSLAKFYVKLFAVVKERVSSVEWAQGRQVIADRRAEYEECREIYRQRTRERKNNSAAVTESYKQLARHVSTLDRELAMDMREREAVEKSVSKYLCEALVHFGHVVTKSWNMDEEQIFDIIHLWLENLSCEEVHPVMGDIIRRAPSAKFVPLVYQLVSRLQRVSNDITAPERDFQGQLADLIRKLCREHPFHSMPLLYSIINDIKGAKHTTTRQMAVMDVVQQLKKDYSASLQHEKLAEVMNTLLKAYINLANCNVDKYTKGGRHRNIRFTELQGRSEDFSACMDKYLNVSDFAKSSLPCVLTRHLKIQMDTDYSDAPRVIGFKNTFSIPESGISHPKIIDCLGSDGVAYRQLVKGGDDTRQDAVISQVFEHVNRMFQQNHETRKRQLNIRTYKVIPTTEQSGVIEWVQDTVPFGGYLCDSKDGSSPGAHSRYYPYDLTHMQCREKLSEAKENLEAKFREITSRFHPAFRYFFLERFPHPTEWMTARLAYTRSVAATSMIGYLLGVGDRHSHNILIDTKTGEVVHIDFGIMFEQGKALGIPETVPFRLTPDIIDGMGISGYEGTYRKCCEEVLKVLRSNVSQLLTILEVIIHDPLYKWTLSPLQARKRQGGISRHHAVAAESTAALRNPSRDAAHRALLRIKGKLQGYEDPNGDSLSVTGQVEFLINEAKDPRNLCKLYAGWSPWL